MSPPLLASLVDVHAHFLTARYVREGRAAGHEHPDGMPSWPTYSVEEHLRQLDARGVERALLSISSPGVHFGHDAAASDLARHVNDAGHELAVQHPDRFGLLASLPLPDVDAACTETARSMDDLGAQGVVLESQVQGRYPGDPRFGPLLTELDERAALVLLHPTSPVGYQNVDLGRPRPMVEFLFDTARAVIDLALSGALARYPSIRWIVPHGGGVLPLLVDRLDLFRAAFAGDSADARDMSGMLAGLWFDSAGTPLSRQLPVLADVVGPDRIVYGSDSCWTPPAPIDQQLAMLGTTGYEGETWRDRLARNTNALLAGECWSTTPGSV